MEFKMRLTEKPFYKIKSGEKNIELRLYDEKRRNISVGDTIEFSNIETGQVINVLVTSLHIYSNFEELFKEFDKTRLGFDKDEEANPDFMLKFYSKEEIDKYGAIGIGVKLV
jgi:ASC-1-like (ASCH) protein